MRAQKRLATVERRSTDLKEVFVKYEKANIEQLQVSLACFVFCSTL